MTIERIAQNGGVAVDVPSLLEHELISRGLFGGAGVAMSAPRPRHRWPAVLVPAALVAALAWVVLSPPRPTPLATHEFQARGSAEGALAVRAFCEAPNIGGATHLAAISQDPGPNEIAACPVNGALRFAYTAPRAGVLSVFSVDEGGGWARVGPPDGLRLKAAHELSPVDLTLAVGPFAAARLVRLVFAYGEGPLDAGEAVSRSGKPGSAAAGYAFVTREIQVCEEPGTKP